MRNKDTIYIACPVEAHRLRSARKKPRFGKPRCQVVEEYGCLGCGKRLTVAQTYMGGKVRFCKFCQSSVTEHKCNKVLIETK